MNDMAQNIATNGEEKDEEGPWSQLLPEVLNLIASRAFFGDLGGIISIRSVCKSWNLLDIDTVRRFTIPLSIKEPIQAEYLISLRGNICEFFHPNHTFQMDIPELAGAYVRFSRFGWLLLSRKDKSNFLFNPLTRQKIELPRSDDYDGFSTMCFSSPPTSSNCYVIGWTCSERLPIVGIIKPGELEWSYYDGERDKSIYSPKSHPLFYQDYCYCMRSDGNIAVFNLKNKSFSVIVNPLRRTRYYHRRIFLVGKNAGHLLAVFVPIEEQNIYIHRINLVKKIWQPIQNLKNQMLFVSPTSSFLKPAPVKAMGNKIYFQKIRDSSWIFYSLSIRMYHSFMGDYSNKSPWNIKQLTNCAWFEPITTSCNQGT